MLWIPEISTKIIYVTLHDIHISQGLMCAPFPSVNSLR